MGFLVSGFWFRFLVSVSGFWCRFLVSVSGFLFRFLVSGFWFRFLVYGFGFGFWFQVRRKRPPQGIIGPTGGNACTAAMLLLHPCFRCINAHRTKGPKGP